MLLIPLFILALTGAREAKSPGACADRNGFGAGTVGVFGGKQTDGRSLTVLDLANRPTLLRYTGDGPTAVRVPLASGAGSLDAAGLARGANGNLCALVALGRGLRCFNGTSGANTMDRRLPTRAQGLWNVGTSLVYADYEYRPGRFLLRTEDGAGFSALRARAAPDTRTALTSNLFTCGSSLSASTPCWFLGSSSTVSLVDASGGTRDVDLSAVLGSGGGYPLRDAAVLPTGDLWLLLNDPPADPDLLAGDARRLVYYSTADRRSRSVELPRAARAILGAGPDSAIILFRDGSAADCRLAAESKP